MAIALAEAGADICLVMREPPPGTQPNMSTADAIRALHLELAFRQPH